MEETNVVEMMERLEAVAEALELASARLVERQVELAAEAEETVGRIVATVASTREAELERRLAETEARLAEVMASVQTAPGHALGRKTLPAGVTSMLSKQGVTAEAGAVAIEAGALDGALASLSVEQRLAVKSELLRAGLLD